MGSGADSPLLPRRSIELKEVRRAISAVGAASTGAGTGTRGSAVNRSLGLTFY
jgi:hypothetical protein